MLATGFMLSCDCMLHNMRPSKRAVRSVVDGAEPTLNLRTPQATLESAAISVLCSVVSDRRPHPQVKSHSFETVSALIVVMTSLRRAVRAA